MGIGSSYLNHPNRQGIEMKTQLEVANTKLFGPGSLGVSNVKLFPGDRRDATPEQFAEQINKALSQIENGAAEEIQDDLCA